MWVAKDRRSWCDIVNAGCWSETNNNIHKHFSWELRYQAMRIPVTLLIAGLYGFMIYLIAR